MIRAELIQLEPCVPGDPCFEAVEWRGLDQQLDPSSIGTCWKVVIKESGEVIGNGGFLVLDDEDAVAEIYFRLEGDWKGRSALASAIRSLVDLGFRELELEKIRAWCLDRDRELREAYRRAGLELEEVMRQSRLVDGSWHDTYLFCALAPPG